MASSRIGCSACFASLTLLAGEFLYSLSNKKQSILADGAPIERHGSYQTAPVSELSVSFIQGLKGLPGITAWVLVWVHKHRQPPAGQTRTLLE